MLAIGLISIEICHKIKKVAPYRLSGHETYILRSLSEISGNRGNNPVNPWPRPDLHDGVL
jgi:hypothetical protein